MESKRLYRSITDRKIAGVAGGLAEYFVMDPLLVRLIFVVAVFAGGGGFLIYLILWIVTPEKPYEPANAINQPTMDNQQSHKEAAPSYQETPKPENPKPAQEKQHKGSLIGGLILITLGALFMVNEFIPNIDFGDLWPVILIVLGIGILINAISGKKKSSLP